MKHIRILFFLFSVNLQAQSTLDTLNIIDKFGDARGNYCSRLDVLDIYGGLRGQSGFDSTKVLDKWGTFGTMTCTTTAAFIGYQNQAGELSTHRQSWTTSGQTLPLILPVPAGTITILGAIAGTEIIATGSIVTTGGLNIAGTATNINTATPPGTQKGGGIVTLVDPQQVGINGIANINVQAGATLRLGNDWTKVHGWFYGTGSAQMANLGVLEVRGLSYKSADQQNGGNASATSITRYIGKADGTTFYDACNTPNTSGQSFQNLGLVEIDNCVWRPRQMQTTGPGTIRVKDGGTLITMMATQSQKVYISGNGGNATDYPKIAFGIETSRNFYSTSNIELEADATIAYQGAYAAGFGYFPQIISTIDKTLSIGCPTVGGTASPGWGSSSYTSFQVANPSLLGPVKVEYGTLGLHVANAMPNSAGLTVNSNARIASNISNTITSVTMVDANSILAVTNTTGVLTANTLNATNGFKVDLTVAMATGTYTILTATNGDKPIPTIGINSSGRTASFAWSGNNLVMTLI